MRTQDIHWAAGFLEGEGSFFGNWQKIKYWPVVKADTTDVECLERLRELFGGSIQKEKPRASRKGNSIAYQWRVTGRRAIEAMMILRPLMAKRRQCQIDLTFERCLDQLDRFGGEVVSDE